MSSSMLVYDSREREWSYSVCVLFKCLFDVLLWCCCCSRRLGVYRNYKSGDEYVLLGDATLKHSVTGPGNKEEQGGERVFRYARVDKIEEQCVRSVVEFSEPMGDENVPRFEYERDGVFCCVCV